VTDRLDTARPHTIGFLIDRWEPGRGGAERALAALVRHVQSHGHRALVFALRAASDAPGELHRVTARGLTRSARERSLARALEAAAADAGCDVTVGIRHLSRVDLYWPHGGLHAETVLARERARRGTAPIRHVAALRGRHRTFVDFERALLERGGARRIVCVSHLVERELSAAYPACRERLRVIENGVDQEHFHPAHRERENAPLRARFGFDARTPLLAFVAREPRIKGLAQLLAALARVRNRRWQLLIAGPKDPKPWLALARRHGLLGAAEARNDEQPRIAMTREIDTRALFCAADLTVHPTWRDTSGLVVLESLACGTPVITTRMAGAAEHVRDPLAGTVLDDPGDVGALAEAIDGWLERLTRAPVDREEVRASVRGLDEHRTCALVEAQILELAASRAGAPLSGRS
jgi:UDP-glucose:(heptosyl)LPS alpha-1,3-glucosyltransferase